MANASMGWMLRDSANSGEIYEPSTVENRIDLRTPATAVAPMIYDIANSEILWADMTLSVEKSGWYVGNTLPKISMAGRAIERQSWTRATLQDLFLSHLSARHGVLVATPEEADLVIAADGHLSPYDVAKIAGEYL
jgi:hypothetical protein